MIDNTYNIIQLIKIYMSDRITFRITKQRDRENYDKLMSLVGKEKGKIFKNRSQALRRSISVMIEKIEG